MGFIFTHIHFIKKIYNIYFISSHECRGRGNLKLVQRLRQAKRCHEFDHHSWNRGGCSLPSVCTGTGLRSLRTVTLLTTQASLRPLHSRSLSSKFFESSLLSVLSNCSLVSFMAEPWDRVHCKRKQISLCVGREQETQVLCEPTPRQTLDTYIENPLRQLPVLYLLSDH